MDINISHSAVPLHHVAEPFLPTIRIPAKTEKKVIVTETVIVVARITARRCG